ncbi:hypothetical protein LAZ67_6003200 [Cordylochernes scorpioides]|uniref:RNA-directed DNA polymerase n=1 Tax=Cordylochernes scorpioides TaxID=51811 RepID=A0ABY6KL03_9ARAC|nr:hypothetical protein LAZ67_6003200 [Cordylochernes scorpioides]
MQQISRREEVGKPREEGSPAGVVVKKAAELAAGLPGVCAPRRPGNLGKEVCLVTTGPAARRKAKTTDAASWLRDRVDQQEEDGGKKDEEEPTRGGHYKASSSTMSKYKPGRTNGNIDALSRLPLNESPNEVPNPPEVFFIEVEHAAISSSEVTKLTNKDSILSRIKFWTMNGWPEQRYEEKFKDFSSKSNEILVHKDCLLWGSRVIIPEMHDTHVGIVGTKALAQVLCWWPNMDKDIERMVSNCRVCLSCSRDPPKTSVYPSIWPSRPWSRLHIDHARPFQGKLFLVVVNAFLKWTDAKIVPLASAETTIKVLKEMFATHEIVSEERSKQEERFMRTWRPHRAVEEGQEIVARNYHVPKWLPGVVYEKKAQSQLKWELIMEELLNEIWISNNVIHPAQHGFTQEKSTISALQEITKLSIQKRETENTAIVTVDISGAFDNAWHPAILQQLDKANFPACADAFRMLTVAYREATLDRSNVYRWYKMFSEGREDVNDDERAGRPSTSTTDEKINEVEKMILANRRITVREVAEDLNISIGSCHSIFINDLGMRRVAAKFVPKLLNCDQKQQRMNIANEMLDCVRDDPNLLQRVITGEEAWVYGLWL